MISRHCGKAAATGNLDEQAQHIDVHLRNEPVSNAEVPRERFVSADQE